MVIKHGKSIAQNADGTWWYSYRLSTGHPDDPLRTARCYPRVCSVCSRTFVPYPSHHQPTCSRQCGRKILHRDNPALMQGAKAPRWKGGRRRHRGYIQLYRPADPTLAGTKRSYVWEHRAVMEQHIGRKLTRSETVHHINGIRDDNRIENLQLRSGSHGAGIAHKCLDCGSNNIAAVPIADREL